MKNRGIRTIAAIAAATTLAQGQPARAADLDPREAAAVILDSNELRALVDPVHRRRLRRRPDARSVRAALESARDALERLTGGHVEGAALDASIALMVDASADPWTTTARVAAAALGCREEEACLSLGAYVVESSSLVRNGCARLGYDALEDCVWGQRSESAFAIDAALIAVTEHLFEVEALAGRAAERGERAGTRAPDGGDASDDGAAPHGGGDRGNVGAGAAPSLDACRPVPPPEEEAAYDACTDLGPVGDPSPLARSRGLGGDPTVVGPVSPWLDPGSPCFGLDTSHMGGHAAGGPNYDWSRRMGRWMGEGHPGMAALKTVGLSLPLAATVLAEHAVNEVLYSPVTTGVTKTVETVGKKIGSLVKSLAPTDPDPDAPGNALGNGTADGGDDTVRDGDEPLGDDADDPDADYDGPEAGGDDPGAGLDGGTGGGEARFDPESDGSACAESVAERLSACAERAAGGGAGGRRGGVVYGEGGRPEGAGAYAETGGHGDGAGFGQDLGACGALAICASAVYGRLSVYARLCGAIDPAPSSTVLRSNPGPLAVDPADCPPGEPNCPDSPVALPPAASDCPPGEACGGGGPAPVTGRAPAPRR